MGWDKSFSCKLERSANEGLVERCSIAERRLEAAEMRGQGLANELRETQDGRYQIERQMKSISDKLERLKANAERMEDENTSLRVSKGHVIRNAFCRQPLRWQIRIK